MVIWKIYKKEDSVRIEDLKDIMFVLNKDMQGAWGTGEETMNNKKIYTLKIHKRHRTTDA